MSARVGLVVIAFVLVVVMSASGTVISVPGDEPSIQEGIRAAADGDTVLVAPGTYHENVKILHKNVVLASHYILAGDEQFIENTIIDGSTPAHPDTGSCVIIAYGQDAATVLEGFTLTGGTGTAWQDLHDQLFYREGGGVLMDLCAPVIRHNHVVDNEATSTAGGMASAGGGGIRSGDSDPLIEGNIVENNRGRYGAGIVMFYSTGVIRKNIIIDNSGGQDYGGGGIWLSGDGLTVIENNTIVGNSSTGSGAGGTGGAINLTGEMAARNNIVWGNTQSTGQQINGARRAEVVYNCIEGGFDGIGNINQDPLFADDQYYLSANSPCIDAGDPASTLDPDGTRADMGAKVYYHFDAPYIWFIDRVLDDSDGNGNGFAEGGETVEVVITVLNTSLDATGVSATLACEDPDVQVLQGTAAFGDLAQNNTASNDADPYSFTVEQDAVAHGVIFTLTITAGGGYQIIYTMDLVVGTAAVLLVDDDSGAAYETVYTDALETKGIFPAHWDISDKGRPGIQIMQPYNVVIWFTGDDRETSLTAEEQAVIAEYLDGGGNLFLSGADIAYDLAGSGSAGDAAFFADYLHAEYISDGNAETFLYGVQGDPITGQFTFFALDAGQTSADVIAPLEGASTSMIYYTSQQTAAIRYSGDYKLIYFAVGLDDISAVGGGSSDQVRGTLLQNAINWFSYVPTRGDVTQDGTINVLDVLTAVNIILNVIQPNPEQEWAADCSGDAIINILDVLGIVNVILGIGTCSPAAGAGAAPEAVEYLRSLESYLTPEHFTRLMALVGEVQVPVEFSLDQNYPNPFNPSTTISYSLPVQSGEFRVGGGDGTLNSKPFTPHVTLKIFNVMGQEVAVLVDRIQEPGYYTVTWDASNMASGVYFCRLSAGDFTATKQMMLVR